MTAKPKTFVIFATTLLLILGSLLGVQGCRLFGSDGDGGGQQNPTSRGYFRISAPATGERWNLDSIQTILWAPSDSVLSGNVRISLYQGETFLANLISNGTNSGSYPWRPSITIANSGYRWGSGDNYRIRIAASDDTSRWDWSGSFSLQSLYSGFLAVTSPAANAKVRMDSSYAIRWDASGNPGPYLGIQLYRDTLLLANLTSSALPSGYYLWSGVANYVSNFGSGDQYLIRVFSTANPAISNTSGKFSLVSAYSGGFTVKAPKAGDTLIAGSPASVSWSATGDPGTGVYVTLWRDSIQTGSIASSASINGTATFTPSATLVSSNRYRVRVTSVSDPGLYAFSGYFRIAGMEPDEYEIDDSLRAAKSISVDGKPQQHTLTSLDQDWVAFSASLGKRYLINAKSTSAMMYLYVYDSTGRSLNGSTSGSNPQSILTPARAGRYYARVSSYSGYGPYSISVMEFDSASAPFNIAFAAPTGKSTWAAGTAYTIQYTPDTSFFGTLVSLALYQDTTLVQTIYSGLSNSGAYAWTVPASLFTSDRYRIRISNYSNSSVYAYSPFFTISGATPDDFEPDNAKAAAKLLPAGGTAQAHTLSSGDIDWMRFPAQTGKRYIASVKTNSGSVEAYAYDVSGSSIAYQSGSQFSLVMQPTVTGDHYLKITPYSGSALSYTVSLTATDTSSAGIPVTFTSPDSASTWASGSPYTVAWIPDSSLLGTSVTLSLYMDNAFVRTIYSGLTNSGAYSWTIPSGLTTSNRYRIRIANYGSSALWGQSAAFTISGISPDAYEPDNNRSQAKTITTDGAAQQRNIVLGDTDWVAIDAVLGKTYIISASSSTTVYLYLLDSLGAQLQSTSGTRPSVVLNPTRAGRHYARVQYYSGTGAYTLTALGFKSDNGGVDAKFTAPAESTTWAVSAAYTAMWTPDSALFGTAVSLALCHDTTLIQNLASGASNLGRYSVSLPSGLASSNRYRLRLSNYAYPQIFGYSPFFTVSGIAPDSLEPNDTVGAARSIAPNSGRLGLSLSMRDRDWFKFPAKSKKLYLIQTAASSTLYTLTRLMNAAGTALVMSVTKSSSLDSLPTISWVSPGDDNYSVSVEPSSASYYGNYGFEIKEVDPASYSFSVTGPAAAASVKLGGTLTVTWTDPAGLKGNVDIFLYNASGVVQTVVAGAVNSGTYAWLVPATLTAGADYYIKVISRTSDAISGNSGVFSIAP